MNSIELKQGKRRSEDNVDMNDVRGYLISSETNDWIQSIK